MEHSKEWYEGYHAGRYLSENEYDCPYGKEDEMEEWKCCNWIDGWNQSKKDFPPNRIWEDE